MANAINWFEIPATNFKRAKDFYAQILDADLHLQQMGGFEMAFLPMEGDGVGGAVVFGEGYAPSANGTVPYLNGGEDLSSILNRVEAAGGQIMMPKTKISDEIGFMAHFFDTEGNRIALHSKS